MLTEDQVINVLQKFSDQFRSELNKLTMQLDDMNKKLEVARSNIPEPEKETQVKFEVKTEEPKQSHPRTGDYTPGSPEVAVENFFYSGTR